MAETQDPVADVLRQTNMPDAIRANAWDAFHSATNADDLAAKLKEMPLTQGVKASLWDLKHQTAPPSDATSQASAAPKTSTWQRLANAVGPAPTREDMMQPWAVHALSPELEKKATDPLIRATGVDAVDNLTSPLSVAQMAVLGAKPAATGAFKMLSSLVSSVEPEIASEIVGLLSPRAAHALKLAKLATKVVKSATPETPPQAPAIEASGPTPPAAPPAAVPVEAPATAGSAMPNQRALNEAAIAARRAAYKAARGGGSPAAAQREAAQPKPPTADAPAQPATSMAMASANALKLSASETSVYLNLLKRGVSATKAIENILTQREFLKKFPGPSPSEVAKAVAHRGATGEW